jgi:hypothetical protein
MPTGGAVEADQASVRPGQTTARSCKSISGASWDRRWMRPAASASRRMADQAGERVGGGRTTVWARHQATAGGDDDRSGGRWRGVQR